MFANTSRLLLIIQCQNYNCYIHILKTESNWMAGNKKVWCLGGGLGMGSMVDRPFYIERACLVHDNSLLNAMKIKEYTAVQISDMLFLSKRLICCFNIWNRISIILRWVLPEIKNMFLKQNNWQISCFCSPILVTCHLKSCH